MNVRKIDEESADDGRVVEFAPHRPTVGEWLREARESYGLKLGDVSSTLRIRQTYLEALEADRFEDLPGSTYAIGFLRAYSDYLGLDGIALVQRFREQAGEDHTEEELSFPVPKSDNRVPRGAILLMSLVLAVVAYGAWYMLQGEENQVVTDAAPPPVEETTPAAAPPRETATGPSAPAPTSIAAQAKQENGAAAGTTSARSANAAEPRVAETAAVTTEETAAESAAGAAEAPATVDAAAAPETADTPAAPVAEEPAAEVAAAPDAAPAPAAETVTETAAAEDTPAAATGEAAATEAAAANESAVPVSPVPKPAAPATAETDASSDTAAAATQTASAPPAPPAAPAAPAAVEPDQIVIRAQVDSWVEVRDSDNAPLVSRLLRAGDEYKIPTGQGLKLVTGNAGALSVFVDGNEVPPLAPPGAVRRYIALDAERLRQGTALIE